MRVVMTVMLAIAVSSDMAGALDGRYDEKLAQAAADIVASRMGSLRGGFDVNDRVDLAIPTSQQEAPRGASQPAAGVWRDGLAIAVERDSTVSPDL